MRKFERVYLAAEGKAAVAGREFGLEGFGRADLVWLAWQSRESADEFTALALKKRIRLTAIEGKVSDWRKGLPGRYATAGEVADDLRLWLTGQPIHARRAKVIENSFASG